MSRKPNLSFFVERSSVSSYNNLVSSLGWSKFNENCKMYDSRDKTNQIGNVSRFVTSLQNEPRKELSTVYKLPQGNIGVWFTGAEQTLSKPVTSRINTGSGDFVLSQGQVDVTPIISEGLNKVDVYFNK